MFSLYLGDRLFFLLTALSLFQIVVEIADLLKLNLHAVIAIVNRVPFFTTVQLFSHLKSGQNRGKIREAADTFKREILLNFL